MDTDDLSKETYRAIISTAESFHHDLTIEFGVLSYNCKTDDDFLNESESMINEWLTEWDLEEVIMDVFSENEPSKEEFRKMLENILEKIKQVRKIPIGQRKFEQW
jgi:hypothetical protein